MHFFILFLMDLAVLAFHIIFWVASFSQCITCMNLVFKSFLCHIYPFLNFAKHIIFFVIIKEKCAFSFKGLFRRFAELKQVSRKFSDSFACAYHLSQMDRMSSAEKNHVCNKDNYKTDTVLESSDATRQCGNNSLEKVNIEKDTTFSTDSNMTTPNSEFLNSASPRPSKEKTRRSVGKAKKSPGAKTSPEKESTWAIEMQERSRGYCHKFIDSHCHIDLIYDRLGLPNSMLYADFKGTQEKSYPANYEGCVAIFCNPQTFDLHGKFLTDTFIMWYTI